MSTANDLAEEVVVERTGAGFQLHADGELWRYTGTPCSGTSCPGWQHLDHNARTEAIFTGPGLYQVHAN